MHRPELLTRLPHSEAGIYTLGGERQVGKSTLLKQLVDFLLQEPGADPRRIGYFTGELFRDADDLRRTLADFVDGAPPGTGLVHILVDEITWVADWDRAVKFLADAGVLDRSFVLLTGSDLVLPQDAMMHLPGRRGRAEEVDFHLRPLSFLEFCQLRAIVP